MRVAAVQMDPPHLDVAAGLERIEHFAAAAAEQGATLAVFPELVVPGYPIALPDPFADGKPGVLSWPQAQEYLNEYAALSQVLPGPFTERLGKIAKAHGIGLVAGVSERDPTIRATLWNSSVVIGADGSYRGRHRKLVAVMHERFYFNRGDAEDIAVFDCDGASVGVCICFENHHALYRRALAQLGEEIHCALWTSPLTPEMAKRGERRETHRELAVAHGRETGAFTVVASQVSAQPDLERSPAPHRLQSGGSLIVDPFGRTLAAVEDFQEGIAVADLDVEAGVKAARFVWSSFGDDAREDLFRLTVAGRER